MYWVCIHFTHSMVHDPVSRYTGINTIHAIDGIIDRVDTGIMFDVGIATAGQWWASGRVNHGRTREWIGIPL